MKKNIFLFSVFLIFNSFGLEEAEKEISLNVDVFTIYFINEDSKDEYIKNNIVTYVRFTTDSNGKQISESIQQLTIYGYTNIENDNDETTLTFKREKNFPVNSDKIINYLEHYKQQIKALEFYY